MDVPFSFSFFDARLYNSDVTPNCALYIIQKLEKCMWRDMYWRSSPESYTSVKDAIIQMRIRANREEGQYAKFRVVCRIDVPVAFDFSIIPPEPIDKELDKEESDEEENPKEEV